MHVCTCRKVAHYGALDVTLGHMACAIIWLRAYRFAISLKLTGSFLLNI